MNRILYQKGTENTQMPSLPIVIGMDDLVAEASSIREAVALVIGSHYLDSLDQNLDWNLRVEAARKESMKALMYDIEAVVYDNRTGIIKDNFAADDDEDYELDEEPERIYVDNDKVFLLSLAKINAIRLLERTDSFFFNQDLNPTWNKDDFKEYPGGKYINVAQEYNIDELINKHV